MWSDFFFSCVFSCVCARRRNARFWHIKSKFFWEMNLSFVMNLCTWKRIGARKKHVIRFFFLMCIFMRLCAAQKRTILRNKIKVFLRNEWDESLHLKTHRRTEKMTYNPNFDFGAVYTNTFNSDQYLQNSMFSIKCTVTLQTCNQLIHPLNHGLAVSQHLVS